MTENTKQDKKSESQADKSSHNSNNLDINKKKQDEGVTETKKAEDKKKEKKKELKSEGPKKTEAVVHGRDLRISTKQAVAICRFIRGKDVDKAIADLEQVVKMKRAVPMKGEIPHRRGKGMMSGRYPVKAAKDFIRLLKSLKANAINHEIELEKVRIVCMANIASKPYKRFGQGRMKRSHVEIKLIPFERFKKFKRNKSKSKQDKKSKVNDSKSEQVSDGKHATEVRTPKNENLDINKINEEEDEE